jgi:hypothetical protein
VGDTVELWVVEGDADEEIDTFGDREVVVEGVLHVEMELDGQTVTETLVVREPVKVTEVVAVMQDEEDTDGDAESLREREGEPELEVVTQYEAVPV